MIEVGGLGAKCVTKGEKVDENLGRAPDGAEAVQHRDVGNFRKVILVSREGARGRGRIMISTRSHILRRVDKT